MTQRATNPPRPYLLHLLWAAVTLASVWSLGRDYRSGQATLSSSGAQMVWAQLAAQQEHEKGILQKLHNHGERE